ncbi:MAG: DNA repair protein RadC [Gammaproteobacteria bacterium]|nr:DNA repair protein RadC [Gammaproteobacteria bacterium]
MSIKHWPLHERPRERLLACGAAALSDAELLAILIRSGTRGRDAVAMAREVLTVAGGLTGLLQRPLDWHKNQSGLGLSSFAALQAANELMRRQLGEVREPGAAFVSPQSTRTYLRAWLGVMQREVFACLFLDNRHRLLAREILFLGSINSATVHPREVVKRALGHNAAAVILAHNHPSGVAEPSAADRAITRELVQALALVEVRVLDHFVVGDEVTSFAERGLL